MLLLILSSFLLGIILTLAVQLFFLHKFYEKQPECEIPYHSQYSTYKLPKEILDAIKTPDIGNKKESCVALNLLFQFLFRELKDTKMVRKWVIKKMNVEFDEMLQSKPGRLLEQITVRDFNLGDTFPVVRSVRVKDVKLQNDETAMEELDIIVDLTYSGGYQLAVDVDLVFGKSAYLMVKIAKLKGVARLQFSRLPYTHWSFSFCQEPEIDFQVESQLGNRPIPQVTSLIINQIRRTIRKKHTLPNYKFRYKPFFTKPVPAATRHDVSVSGTAVTRGQLSVTVIECSRLLQFGEDCSIYCTLAIDEEAWVGLDNHHRKLWITHDLEVICPSSQSVGLIYKGEFVIEKYAELPVVDTVIPNTPASLAGLKKDDLIISVGGTRVSSAKMVGKLIRQAGDKFVVRVERASGLRNKQRQSRPMSNINPFDTSSGVAESFITKDQKDGAGRPRSVSDDFIFVSDKQPDVLDENKSVSDPAARFTFLSSKAKIFQRSKIPSPSGNSVSSRSSPSTSPAMIRKNSGSSNFSKTIQNDDRYSEKHHVRRKSTGDTASIQQVTETTEQKYSSDTLDDSIPQLSEKENDSYVELKKTKFVKMSDIPKWNETFIFDVEDKSNYLNVGAWCHLPEKLDKQNRIIKPEKDILLGHVSIPVADMALDCLMTLQGDTQTTFNLSPPDLKPSVSKSKFAPLQAHPGFDISLCYGDITLGFHHILGQKTEKKQPDTAEENAAEDESSEDEPIIMKMDSGNHDFVATNFHAATYCNFCSKKIWLKVAFQCRSCAMICHKKCTERCQAQTQCTRDAASTKLIQSTNAIERSVNEKTSLPAAILNKLGRRSRERLRSQTSPESSGGPVITYQPPTPDQETKPFIRPRSNSAPRNKLENTSGDDMQRTYSSTSLEAMSGHKRSSSISRLRGYESDSSSDNDEVNLIQYLKEQQKVQQADELVVMAAKEMGKELFANLTLEERRDKLDAMVSKLQQEIDCESENRHEFFKLEREAMSSEQKKQFQAKVRNADDKIQALALLMLHYCAGLQHCLDLMEEQRQGKEEAWELMDLASDGATGNSKSDGTTSKSKSNGTTSKTESDGAVSNSDVNKNETQSESEAQRKTIQLSLDRHIDANQLESMTSESTMLEEWLSKQLGTG